MYRLLQLLLGSDVGGVSAFLLTTIGGSGMKTSVTFTANHFVGIVFLGQKSQGWFNDTTTKSQHQMKSRFCKKRNIFSSTYGYCEDKEKFLKFTLQYVANAL